jgi:ribonuclease HI
LIAYTDGAARGNPGPAGIGVVIADGAGRILAEVGQGIGVATNNVAEYLAAVEALRRALELGATDLVLRSDSRLLVEQLSGRWRVKNPTLIRLHGEARALVGQFRSVTFEHVRRERNREADRLANLGVDSWLAGRGHGYRRVEPGDSSRSQTPDASGA